jgi:hypothetical protein
MKFAVEMTSGGIMYILSFMNIGAGVQKLLEEDAHTDTHGRTHRAGLSHKPTFVSSK